MSPVEELSEFSAWLLATPSPVPTCMLLPILQQVRRLTAAAAEAFPEDADITVTVWSIDQLIEDRADG